MPILLIVFQLACIAGGMRLAMRLKARDPESTLATAGRRVPYLKAAILLLTLAFAASFMAFCSDAFEQRLPLIVQRDAKLAPTLAALVLFGGLSGFLLKLAFAEEHPRRMRYRVRIVLGNVLLGILVAAQNTPVAPLLADAELDGRVLQTSAFSCGPACVATVARSLGRPLTETQASQLLGTAFSGTTFGQTRYALGRLGIANRTLDGKRPLGDIVPPALLAVDQIYAGPERHLVVLTKQDGDVAVIFDPLTGLQRWPARKLAAIWHGHGIECSKP
jgi:hypothetical protein